MGPQNPNGRHGSMRLLSNLIFVCTLVVFCTSAQGKSNSMFKINFASLNLEIPKESICSVEVHNLTMAAMTLFVNQQDECMEVGITYLPESNVSGGLAKKLGLNLSICPTCIIFFDLLASINNFSASNILFVIGFSMNT